MNKTAIPFSLGYESLKLLGKGMYSNVWSALSELVANGIDANASKVYIYIDMSDKQNSIIEILDNGNGMSEEDIKNRYVVIGDNKRGYLTDSSKQMGRKGVGKLAALFLSSKFQITTKVLDMSESGWLFDFNNREFAVPSLVRTFDKDFAMLEQFNKEKSGTHLKLFDVNLTNMADEAINALSLIMANYFIYENLPNVEVGFFVKKLQKEIVDFTKPLLMQKKIAFENMMGIITSSKEDLSNKKYKCHIDYGESFATDYLSFNKNILNLKDIDGATGVFVSTTNNKQLSIPYELKGWVGIHSSINMSEAQNNDKNFIKNKYYSPTKLRLYIRNKLAVENFLPYIKNTQQGANYIEGEISFDLLDVDLLEDITTSNRQDVDIHDSRVMLLVELVSRIVNKLISMRNEITKLVSAENSKRKAILQGRAKRNAQKTIGVDLRALGLSEDETNKILPIIESKYQGMLPPEAKEIYKIFISHASRDKRFSDFIYNLLITKGAVENDIFYTSVGVNAGQNLKDDIKNNIMKDNVLVLFLDSANFHRSQYCLFEGGAYWATRSVYECWHLHFDRSWIPDYIFSAERYHVPLNSAGTKINDQTFEITQKKYSELASLINVLIEHINKSSLHNMKKMTTISIPIFESPHVMQQKMVTFKDYIDADFLKCWEYYVVNGETDLKTDGRAKSKDEFIFEYNELVDKFNT